MGLHFWHELQSNACMRSCSRVGSSMQRPQSIRTGMALQDMLKRSSITVQTCEMCCWALRST